MFYAYDLGLNHLQAMTLSRVTQRVNLRHVWLHLHGIPITFLMMLNTSPLSCLLIVFSSQFTRRRRWNASFLSREKRFSDHVPTVCIRTTNWVRMESARSDINKRDCVQWISLTKIKKRFPSLYKRRLAWLSSLQCSLQLRVIDLGYLKCLINLSYYSSCIAKAISCFNACTTNKLYWSCISNASCTLTVICCQWFQLF